MTHSKGLLDDFRVYDDSLFQHLMLRKFTEMKRRSSSSGKYRSRRGDRHPANIAKIHFQVVSPGDLVSAISEDLTITNGTIDTDSLEV